MKILVTDDEADVVEFVGNFIKKLGHSVDQALDGAQALHLVKNNEYDLIFVDYNLPNKSGLEIVNYIKKHNFDTKTVVITGYPCLNESIAKFVGADEFLQKPIDLQIIKKVISKYQKSSDTSAGQ